jgi:hypothetical protein
VTMPNNAPARCRARAGRRIGTSRAPGELDQPLQVLHREGPDDHVRHLNDLRYARANGPVDRSLGYRPGLNEATPRSSAACSRRRRLLATYPQSSPPGRFQR